MEKKTATPAAKPAANQSTGSGLNPALTIPVLIAISVLSYMFILGDASHFLDAEKHKPKPGDFFGLIHSGGVVVPILMTCFLCVVVFSIERFFTINKASGTGNIDAFVRKVRSQLDTNNIADAIKEYHKQGRPVLVGSASIAKNELIASWLDKEKIPYEILNAKNNEREAAIIEKAGEKGAITLATNIAGRGTDIKLGEGVVELGGLVVIGSERHESRRIDNQLRGRGGRQGDPGETQFYVSTEDDLMRIFQGERIASLMDRLGVDEDTPIQNMAVTKTLEAAQKRVEGYNFDTRKNVVQYDNVINRHRKVVYTIRRKILEGVDIKVEIERLLDLKAKELTVLPAKNNPKYKAEFTSVFPIEEAAIDQIGEIKKDKDRLDKAKKEISRLYSDKEAELEAEILRKVEREVYLQVLDTLWMQHLENMQHLREGIHWRSVGQRDPLVEYRSESQKLFDSLQSTLRDEVIRSIMHVHKHDVIAQEGEEYETELTRLAENAVERGVNEITGGEQNRDSDFKAKKAVTVNAANKKKNDLRKKKKNSRQNKKKNRR